MMTLTDFLLHATKIGELCVIRDQGYIIACAYIDHEDLFMLPATIAASKVVSDKWGTLNVTHEDGSATLTPCHFVNIER